MLTGDCRSTQYIGIRILRLGFEACTAGCVAAAASDLLLALQSLLGACRIYPAVGGELSRVALGWALINAAWSFSGTFMWLQPVGHARPWWFEPLWRGSAQAQALLVATAWLMARAMLRAAGEIAPSTHRWLGRLALMHGAFFGLVTLLPATCRFEQYVLFGGANLTPPLMTLFGVVVTLVRRHSLRWPHPLCLMCAVGLPFWIGNAGVLCGRQAGPTHWIRLALPRLLDGEDAEWLNWDEMATFHVFGCLGNELLWRAFAKLAAAERDAAAARGRDPTTGSPPAGWLEAALGMTSTRSCTKVD